MTARSPDRDTICDWTQSADLGAVLDLSTGRRLDPDEIRSEVRQRAESLSANGVRCGNVVAVSSGSPLETLLGLLGAWRAGACAAILDPSLTAPERDNVARLLRPAAFLAEFDAPRDVGDRRQFATGLDGPALILLTSGTTGAPKAVMHSHRNLLSRVALNQAEIGTETLSKTLVTLPLHFGHGLIGNALTALFTRGELVLPPRGVALANALPEVIDEQGVTFFSSVPSFWTLVLRLGIKPSGKSLRRVHVGSAPLSTELWQRIVDWSDAEVVNCYGITETANWIGGQSSRDGAIGSGRVGRPWGGVYAVRDADGQVTPTGDGEVLVRSPAIMLGYLDRPDLTDACLSDGWYQTGDTGTVDTSGRLTLSGRIKDEINRAGQKVQPADVDLVLAGHPDVEEACAFAVPDSVTGEAVAIAVVPKPGRTLDRKSLKDWCGERLRPSAIPEKWFFVDTLPRTSRGKISRNVVRDTILGG